MDFVETVSSAMTNSIHTCEIGTRSVLFVNAMELEINSQLNVQFFFFFPFGRLMPLTYF